MAAIQYHRGPDGFGYQTIAEKGVGFSHARLSIIDLNENRARQPFRSQDGNLLLAHNGEFYDYKRIRTELTSRGARFTTKSDSKGTGLGLSISYGIIEKHGGNITVDSTPGEGARFTLTLPVTALQSD